MSEVFSATQGKTDFLQMFVAQVKNQDPLSPMDQTDILGQLAQFSQVENLEALNKNFDSFLQQALETGGNKLASTGAALLGRDVEFSGNRSGTVESVRQDGGQVLVKVGGNFIPLADISAVSLRSAA
jgi:flagellar basal-body rod modification protein FlgD